MSWPVGPFARWLLPVLLAQSVSVIPPGQEPVIGRMLAVPDAPGQCRFDGAAIEPVKIVARYVCPSSTPPANFAVELTHAGSARAGTTQTQQFIIAPSGPTAPPTGFIDALARHVRAEEPAFHWNVTESVRPPEESWLAPRYRSQQRTVRRVVFGAILAALVVGGAGQWLRRRRAARGTPPSSPS